MIHSFSSMSTWAKCPRRYKAQYVDRSVKDTGSEATRKGEIVHKEIEDYLKGVREALPAIRPPDGFIEALRLLPEGMVQPERPMAVDHDLKPCDFWSRGALLRGKLDVVVSLGDVLLAVDWKGLPLDTPLPTPTGWTTMGDVAVGDEVIGGDGVACRVVGKSAVNVRDCYRVRFDDKTEVICDDQHLWKLHDGSVVPVTQLRRRDAVDLARPIDTPEVDLPLDPYVLGVWLADGKHTSSEITKPDEFIWGEIERRGYALGGNTVAAGRCPTRSVLGIRGVLRELGVLGSKHIPARYLRASIRQRVDLLRGLMDGDGNANPTRKQAVFTTCDPDLSWQVYELLCSLGQRPNRSVTRQRGFGKEVTAYPLAWRPQGLNPFSLPRKALRIDAAWGPGESWCRRVVAVEPVAQRETQCIAVDSSDNTYLCTRAMIPTHNTGKRRKQDTDLQAKVYSVLLRSAYPDCEVHVVFDYLNNGRDPVIEAKPEDTNAVLSVVIAIEEDKSYPPVPTPLCAWCPVTMCEFNRKG